MIRPAGVPPMPLLFIQTYLTYIVCAELNPEGKAIVEESKKVNELQ